MRKVVDDVLLAMNDRLPKYFQKLRILTQPEEGINLVPEFMVETALTVSQAIG